MHWIHPCIYFIYLCIYPCIFGIYLCNAAMQISAEQILWVSKWETLTCPAVAKNSPSGENFIKLTGEAVLHTKKILSENEHNSNLWQIKCQTYGLTCVCSTLACVKNRKLWQTNISPWFFGSYLLCQVHLQAERASFMIMSVGFSSTSSLFTLSTWDHSWRLSVPVNKELPGRTETFTHTHLLPCLGTLLWTFALKWVREFAFNVPVGCQARFRTIDFNTNCPVFCHWQFTFWK